MGYRGSEESMTTSSGGLAGSSVGRLVASTTCWIVDSGTGVDVATLMRMGVLVADG